MIQQEKEAIKEYISDSIKRERLKRNWTQEKLACKLGLKKMTVCDYENRKCLPSAHVLLFMIKELGFDI